MKTLHAWALVTRDQIPTVGDLFDTRAEAIKCQNKPAGQRVVAVKILEAKEPKTKRLARLSGGRVDILTASVSAPRKFEG